jgi:hypothetical protein
MVYFKNLILVFLLFGFSFIAQAKPIVWKTLHTPRFKILVAKEYIEQGHHIAEQSEKALDQLLKIYSEHPKNKILIVVDHRTNASNGSATHFPYPHIIIYPTLPTAYSSISPFFNILSESWHLQTDSVNFWKSICTQFHSFTLLVS